MRLALRSIAQEPLNYGSIHMVVLFKLKIQLKMFTSRVESKTLENEVSWICRSLNSRQCFTCFRKPNFKAKTDVDHNRNTTYIMATDLINVFSTAFQESSSFHHCKFMCDKSNDEGELVLKKLLSRRARQTSSFHTFDRGLRARVEEDVSNIHHNTCVLFFVASLELNVIARWKLMRRKACNIRSLWTSSSMIWMSQEYKLWKLIVSNNWMDDDGWWLFVQTLNLSRI